MLPPSSLSLRSFRKTFYLRKSAIPCTGWFWESTSGSSPGFWPHWLWSTGGYSSLEEVLPLITASARSAYEGTDRWGGVTEYNGTTLTVGTYTIYQNNKLLVEDTGVEVQFKTTWQGKTYNPTIRAGGVARKKVDLFCQQQQQFTITISSAGSPSARTLVADVETGEATSLVARVYDRNGQFAPNAKVRVEAKVLENSAGHRHHDLRPNGNVGGTPPFAHVVTGDTGADGFWFTYTAPAVAGDYAIKASCTDRACKQEGPDVVRVGIGDLVPLGVSEYFVLIGNTPNHPDNHYLTLEAASRAAVLAALYRAEFPDNPPLHLNDASLERGGVFDISNNWGPPHHEHCRGTEVDVRANDVPGAIPSVPGIRRQFERLAGTVGASAKFEVPWDKSGNTRYDLRHYHVRLLGGKPQCP